MHDNQKIGAGIKRSSLLIFQIVDDTFQQIVAFPAKSHHFGAKPFCFEMSLRQDVVPGQGVAFSSFAVAFFAAAPFQLCVFWVYQKILL
jgi:hypothetical protein